LRGKIGLRYTPAVGNQTVMAQDLAMHRDYSLIYLASAGNCLKYDQIRVPCHRHLSFAVTAPTVFRFEASCRFPSLEWVGRWEHRLSNSRSARPMSLSPPPGRKELHRNVHSQDLILVNFPMDRLMCA